MTTALQRITSVPITYEIDATALTSKVQSYQGLTIAGVDDRDGYKAVSEARKDLKRVRVSIENRCKELKADALAYGKRVDDAAKALTALIEPTEQRLLAEEERIDREKERIRAEAAAKIKSQFDARIKALLELGMTPLSPSEFHPEQMSEEEFQANFADAREEAEKIAKQKAAKLAEQAEEAARLKREREEAEAQLAEQRAAIRREREAQESEARRLADERAKLEAERKAKADAEAAEQRRIEAEKQAAEEAARREALRPDREKMLTVVDAIRAIDVPEVSDHAELAATRVREALGHAAAMVEETINRSLPC